MIRNCVRVSIVIVLLVSASHLANAQAYLRAGVLAGVNLANASLSPDYDSVSPGASRSMRLGPIVGVTLEWGVRGVPVAFQPEMQYVQKGVRVTFAAPAPGVDSTLDVQYNYIEFPVLARIALLEGSTRAYVVIGPNFGYNFSGRGLYESARGASEADYFEHVSRLDLGLDVGGGVEFELSPGMYLLGDVRYTHGFTDVTSDAEGEIWNSRDIKLKTGLKWDLWQARR